jgi:hypothetical protein
VLPGTAHRVGGKEHTSAVLVTAPIPVRCAKHTPWGGNSGDNPGKYKGFCVLAWGAVLHFPNFCFAFLHGSKKSRKRAELKTVNGPSKSGVNLDLDSPMEALGWISAKAWRTHARARQGMHERGAPPGPLQYTKKTWVIWGGPLEYT